MLLCAYERHDVPFQYPGGCRKEQLCISAYAKVIEVVRELPAQHAHKNFINPPPSVIAKPRMLLRTHVYGSSCHVRKLTASQPEIRKRRSGHFRNHALAVFASRTCALPDGRHVQYVSKPDVAFLYHEIYDKQAYLQHGVQLHPGNTVLDVGANIGLFADYAAQKVGEQGRVIAVEPIPPVHAAAQHNLEALRGDGVLPS